MNTYKRTASLLLASTILFFSSASRALAVTPVVDLLTADSFAVLAGDQVTVSNISAITGNVGLSPATWALSPALTCAEVTGTIYSVDSTGPLPCRVTNAGLLTQAKNDLTTAYTDAGGRTPATVLAGSDNQLGGQTLTPGVYSFSSASTANLIGTLTLDTEGDPNAVFVFQAASSLVTDSASAVQFINGSSCNVFWHVPSSATLGTGTNFKGTIMADQSITDAGGSTVVGRFLARIADVVLNNTTISVPTCTASSPTTIAAVSSAASSADSAASVSTCPPISTLVNVPTIISSHRVDADSIFVSWGPYSGPGLDTFIVEYGTINGQWSYNTNVTGFSTTINDLPVNTPIWVRVAARNDCAVGTYGQARLIGGPRLPDTGKAPRGSNLVWYIIATLLIIPSLFLKSVHVE